MKSTYDIILSAEETFAREAALGLIVRRPVTTWHYLIPGMFIFDHLKRNGEIRRYTESFLALRKIALSAARAMIEGAPEEQWRSRRREEIRLWLESLKLHSANLQDALLKEADVLTDHYKNLLTAEGELYADLILHVYQDRDRYASFLRKLTGVEEEVNEALKEKLGNTEALMKRLSMESRVLEHMRERSADTIF